MKKIISVLLCVLLLLSALCASVLAADDGVDFVTDLSGILTYEQWERLESLAQEISPRYHCGVYILIVDDFTEYGNGDVYDVASQIFNYKDNGFGIGADRSGILLLLSMDERDWALFVHGESAEYAFNAYGLSELEDSFLPAFSGNDWYGGLSSYLTTCYEYLALADAGEPVRESAVQSILIVVGVSCLISLLICLVLKGKMKTVRRKVEAQAYVAAGGLNLTESYDHYTHTTEIRRRIERSSSKGESGSGRSGKF